MLRLAAATSALALTCVASAGFLTTEKISLGTFSAPGGQSSFFEYLGNPDNTDDIIGFTVSFIFNDAADPFAWASDLRLDIVFQGGIYSVGGFSTLVNPWDFQGSGSNPAGSYFHEACYVWEGNPFSKLDLKGFQLTNDYGFNGAVAWQDISITLYKVPAPGALALLGMAGVTGARRRRR